MRRGVPGQTPFAASSVRACFWGRHSRPTVEAMMTPAAAVRILLSLLHNHACRQREKNV